MLKNVLLFAFVALCQSGMDSAAGQTPQPVVAAMQWEARPTAADYARFYPTDALEQNVGALVRLSCLVQADQSLECTVLSEEPARLGFGEASLQIARLYRAPAHLNGTPTEMGRVVVPVRWIPEAVRAYNRH